MNNVKAAAEENYKRQAEAGRHGIGVFPEIRGQSVGLRSSRITINGNAINNFVRGLPFCRWTNHCHAITSGSQGISLPADTQILRERQVLEQHEDSIFLDSF